LNELIERSRNDLVAAETKRAQQGKEIREANELIEKDELGSAGPKKRS
jgi:hypothetical protein